MGLSLPINRSPDHELDIKYFFTTNIGDWSMEKEQVDIEYAGVEQNDDLDFEFVTDGEWSGYHPAALCTLLPSPTI